MSETGKLFDTVGYNRFKSLDDALSHYGGYVGQQATGKCQTPDPLHEGDTMAYKRGYHQGLSDARADIDFADRELRREALHVAVNASEKFGGAYELLALAENIYDFLKGKGEPEPYLKGWGEPEPYGTPITELVSEALKANGEAIIDSITQVNPLMRRLKDGNGKEIPQETR